MKKNPTIDLGIESASEFGALTHYQGIWLVDRRDYLPNAAPSYPMAKFGW